MWHQTPQQQHLTPKNNDKCLSILKRANAQPRGVCPATLSRLRGWNDGICHQPKPGSCIMPGLLWAPTSFPAALRHKDHVALGWAWSWGPSPHRRASPASAFADEEAEASRGPKATWSHTLGRDMVPWPPGQCPAGSRPCVMGASGTCVTDEAGASPHCGPCPPPWKL